jgi:hypothetical protein
LKGTTYSDVLAMPIYERRFFLGLLTKENSRRQEEIETMHEKQTRGGKGSRQTRVSGQALKNKMQAGQIPNK